MRGGPLGHDAHGHRRQLGFARRQHPLPLSSPVDKAAEAQKDAQERLDDAHAWVLSTEQGRRHLFNLIYRAAKLDGNAFTGEALSRDYNLGQQSVGRWLLEQLERVDADLTDKMLLEGRRERRNDRVHSAPDASR
jgi:hypothetical protein